MINYRDPNLLFRTNMVVGRVESVIGDESFITISGSVKPDAIELYRLDQVVLLDEANRFVQESELRNDGAWQITVSPRDIGKDNAALVTEIFAVSSQNNFSFHISSESSSLKKYRDFVSAHIPANSKDVPSFKKELKELIISETQKPYVSRSIRDAIATGNNYQTLALENTLREGGRQSRERFLFQIDFRGKTVLDVGANTGENSRIARRLGASLVDGYEYDPFFVETGRAVNALLGMTRVSLFQGDCSRPELFHGMKYDIVLALAVWVYIRGTIKELASVTDVLVFETHTLDHGIEAYYKPILRHFPFVVSLGYTDFPTDPHKSRMIMVFGRTMEAIDNVVRRRFLRIEPYFNNAFIAKYRDLSKPQIRELAEACFDKHAHRTEYSDQERRFGGETYFEVFLAGLFQFWNDEGKVSALVDQENVYLRYLRDSVSDNFIDPNLREITDNSGWLIRKISNKYEDAFNIMNGNVDRVAPILLQSDAGGRLVFKTTTGESISAGNIDGHHRFFMCQLAGVETIHFTVGKDGENPILRSYYNTKNRLRSNYTLEVR